MGLWPQKIWYRTRDRAHSAARCLRNTKRPWLPTSHNFALFLLSSPPNLHHFTSHKSRQRLRRPSQDAVNHLSQSVPPQSVKITSQDVNKNFSTPSSPHPAHLSVDLDFSTAIESFRSNSLATAKIPPQDFPVFTTDSQSTWLPNFPSSLPAPSAHQPQSPVENQQDFVLFDSPQPCQAPNRSSVSLSSQRRHSYLHRRDTKLVTAAAQNQRVAQLLQALGQHPVSSVNANSIANQFYASSAPSSSVSLNQQQATHSARPPVPLFNQSTGSVHQSCKMMNAAGLSQSLSSQTMTSKSLTPYLRRRSGRVHHRL